MKNAKFRNGPFVFELCIWSQKVRRSLFFSSVPFSSTPTLFLCLSSRLSAFSSVLPYEPTIPTRMRYNKNGLNDRRAIQSIYFYIHEFELAWATPQLILPQLILQDRHNRLILLHLVEKEAHRIYGWC